MEVDTALLRVARTVATTGSFSAAAEELGYTQSAVSKQMRALETIAGSPLFARGARGVVPTPAGTVLLARTERIAEQLDALEQELLGLRSPVAGRVVLGGFATTAMALVPRTIARLTGAQGGVVVDFEEAPTPRQLRRLRSGRLDLALIAVGDGLPDYDLDGIESEQLPSGPLLLAVPERHRFSGRTSVHVRELADEVWIGGRSARGEPQFGPWPGLLEPLVAAEIGEWTMRLGFVAAGLGITTVPSLALGGLPSGIRTVRVDDPSAQQRRLLLAWTGSLTAPAALVRRALHREATALAQ